MRNVAFLGVGFGLLLLQSNLHRLVDTLRPSTVGIVWLLALVFDLVVSFRKLRSSPIHSGAVASLRAYLSIPLLFLLVYSVVRATFAPSLPRPIPSFLLPLIVFMGVHEFALGRGAAVSFVLGYASDLVGIAPVGLFTFTFVAMFVLARAAGVRMAAQTPWMQAFVVTVFALIHSVMLLVILVVFRGETDKDAWVPRQLYPLSVPYALATGIIAPVVFYWAERVRAATAVTGPVEGGDP